MEDSPPPPTIADDELEQLERPIRSALDVARRSGLEPAAFKRAFDALCSQLPPTDRRTLVVPWRRSKAWLRQARRNAEQALEQRRWMSLAAHHSFLRMAAACRSADAWRRSLPSRHGEPRRALCFVEVVNGTREQDGTSRHYFLRVPHTVLTPREAVA